jgi:YidC/Oxa1 family membrane protein insertase
MDTRKLITAVLISFLIWTLIQRVFFPQPLQQQPTTAPTTQAVQTQGVEAQPSLQADSPATSATSARLIENDRLDDQIVLGDSTKNNGYEMLTIFSNRGATLRVGQLSNYSESVKDKDKGYELLKPVKYPTVERASLATERVILTDEQGEKLTFNLAGVKWFYETQTRDEGEAVRFWIDLVRGEEKLVRVVKTYTLNKKSFDLGMAITFENLSEEKLSAVLAQMGPIGVRQEDPRAEDRKAFVGTVAPGDKKDVSVSSGLVRTALEKEPNYSKQLGAVDEKVVWAGEVNKYFAALLNSVDDKGNLSGTIISSVEAKAFSDKKEFGEDMTTLWVTRPISVEPKGKQSVYFELYLGPKSDAVFTQPKYQARNYMKTFDTSWCTLQFLADFMTWLLKGLYFVTRNYGIAIILLVVIVRVALHPITKSSQMNMMRMQRDMQKLQPKMNALKAKFKDDREGLNKATMELYKNEGVNPAGQILGCLPMMLQMPLWVALWTALNNTFELRHQPFFLWVKDLAAPDALIHFTQAYDIPLLSGMIGPVHSLNVLPILMMVSMILQQKFAPQSAPSPDADPAQAKQQKVMFYFMGIFFGLILYNAPSGLNLYILTSNFLGLIETRRVRRHLEEEAKQPPKPKTPKSNLWTKLQKRVESMAKEYEEQKTRGQKTKGKK